MKQCFAASNRRIGECTTPNNDSRESTVTVTGDATGGDGHDDSDGNLDLPTLNDLFFKAKAMSRMAVSEPGREPEKPTDPKPLVHNGSVKGGHLAGDRAAGQSPDAGTPVDNSPDGSQGEQSTLPHFLMAHAGLLM